MNKLENKLEEAIKASGCESVFVFPALERITQAFYGNRHFVDSISNIRIKLHPYGCIEKLAARIGIQIPDKDKQAIGRLLYSFSVPTRKWKVKVVVNV